MYQIALDSANAAIRENAKNPLGHRLAAEALIGLGKLEEAAAALEQAETLRPIYQLETDGIRERAWIDTYHAVRSLTRQDVRVFLTDSAVGLQEENNLRHLVNNLGRDITHDRVVPFLTTKHSLDFCLTYAEQAWQHGFSSLVVLGLRRSMRIAG